MTLQIISRPHDDDEFPESLLLLLKARANREVWAWLGSAIIVGLLSLGILWAMNAKSISWWLAAIILVLFVTTRIFIMGYCLRWLDQELTEDIQVWLAESQGRWKHIQTSQPSLANRITTLLGPEEQWVPLLNEAHSD